MEEDRPSPLPVIEPSLYNKILKAGIDIKGIEDK